MTIVHSGAGESKHDYRLRQAEILLRLFRGRDDYLGVADGNDFHPEVLATPLTPERLAAEHLAGERCLGIYLMTTDNTVFASCLDFDNKPHRPDPAWQEKAEKVFQLLVNHGISPVVETSQSGSAAHVWIFFDQPVPAREVRIFWRGVLDTVDVAIPEIYPRQDVLTGKGLGNLIRYPLWNLSHFADVTAEWARIPPIKCLSAVSTIADADLTRAAAEIGFSLTPITQQTFPSGSGKGDSALPPRVRHLLEFDDRFADRWGGDTAGLKDTSRSALVMSIASMLVLRFVQTPDIEAAIKSWCASRNYDKGNRDDWIQGIVNGAYELAAASVMQRRCGPSGVPSPDTPELIKRAFARSVNSKIYKKSQGKKE